MVVNKGRHRERSRERSEKTKWGALSRAHSEKRQTTGYEYNIY